MPTVAIIIPCFNQGPYIREAVTSALAQSFEDLEVIIVDDGSSDPATTEQLKSLKLPRCRVLRTENRGPAAARNAAISETSATYILPLDGDDRIAPTLVERAIPILTNNPSIGIVSCEAEFFGLQTGRWELKPYRFPDILLESSLFVTALFRRSDWVKVGGYKPDMRYGYEDYEFWLSLIELGREVYRIPETLFYYRRTANSMVTGIGLDKKVYSYRKLYEYHKELYQQNMEYIFRRILEQDSSVEAKNTNALAQVFIPGPSGYSEAYSVRSSYIWGQWCELKLETSVLPASLGNVWRLDPGIGPGLYEVAQIRIVCPVSGRTLFEARGDCLRQLSSAAGTALILPDTCRTLLLSFGSDPQVLFGPVQLESKPAVLRVEVVLRATSELAEAAGAFQQLAHHIKNMPVTQ